MKRDVEIIELPNGDELVIAVDNSGSIGMKPNDHVQVPYDVVSYYNFRVAWMECVSAGAEPISIILHNFSGDEAWSSLIKGIKQGMKELNVENISITGSTESNFSLHQSAVGLVIIGQREKSEQENVSFKERNDLKVAVIGKPLVGHELVNNQDDIAPLKVFQDLSKLDNVTILPVGSRGILHELHQLFNKRTFKLETELDLKKSSGPATCFIVVYPASLKHRVSEKCLGWYHEVRLVSR